MAKCDMKKHQNINRKVAFLGSHRHEHYVILILYTECNHRYTEKCEFYLISTV